MNNAFFRSTARFSGFFFVFVVLLGFVDFVAAEPPTYGSSRPRSVSRAIPIPIVGPVGTALNRAANVVAPPNGMSSAVPNAKLANLGAYFPGPKTIYPVGTQEVRWTGRDGVDYSALAFYPRVAPADGGKFAAVVYSHGLGGSAEQFAYLGSAWARCGIVAICLRHPGSDEALWRGKVRPLAELKEAYRTHWPARDRANAIRSAIDFLYGANESGGPLGRDVDLNKIGVAGNDLGALAALLVAGQLPPDNGPSLKDDRVAAVLALSPTVFCDEDQARVVYSLIEAPSMSVTGTEDNGVVGATQAFQRRVPFQNVRFNDRYLATLIGGDHLVYGGHRMKPKQSNDAPYQATIAEISALFWRAYLNDDAIAVAALRDTASGSIVRNAKFEKVLVESETSDSLYTTDH